MLLIFSEMAQHISNEHFLSFQFNSQVSIIASRLSRMGHTLKVSWLVHCCRLLAFSVFLPHFLNTRVILVLFSQDISRWFFRAAHYSTWFQFLPLYYHYFRRSFSFLFLKLFYDSWRRWNLSWKNCCINSSTVFFWILNQYSWTVKFRERCSRILYWFYWDF